MDNQSHAESMRIKVQEKKKEMEQSITPDIRSMIDYAIAKSKEPTQWPTDVAGIG